MEVSPNNAQTGAFVQLLNPWFSDRDGWNHLYAYQPDGKLIKKVVDGKFDINEYYGMDKDMKNIYFTASLEKPVNQYVCKVSLDKGTLTCLAHAEQSLPQTFRR